MRVTHVISNLNLGGAETSLCSLVESTSEKAIDHTVITFLPGGVLRQRLEEAGATVIELDGRRGARGASLLLPCVKAIRTSRPDIVQSWMYHANLAAVMTKILTASGYPLVWGIRQSAGDLRLDKRFTGLTIRVGRYLSNIPARIIYNSTEGAVTHEALGYSSKNRLVIPNGIDCDRFRPRENAGELLRATLGLKSDAILFGRVARYAKMKDFATLLKAFKLILDKMPDAHLILVGEGITPDNQELTAQCRKLACISNVHLLGPRQEIESIYAGLDVLISSSVANEGFPNVIAEALACGTLVAATDTGEAKLIRKGCQVVAAPGDADHLANGIMGLMTESQERRKQLGMTGRAFIESNFSAARCADRYVALYEKLIDGVGHKVSSVKAHP
jgi:glycosyltransferase involved in cell wall biosynthesis